MRSRDCPRPEVVFIVSARKLPKLSSGHLSTHLLRQADSVKTEFHLPWHYAATQAKDEDFILPEGSRPFERDVKLALGWVLAREHLPARLITDVQLEQEGSLQGYRVLFLPTTEALASPAQAEVARFEAAGGLVIRNPPGWAWHTPGEHDAAVTAFLQELAQEAQAAVPATVSGGPHLGAFQKQDGSLAVALVVTETG